MDSFFTFDLAAELPDISTPVFADSRQSTDEEATIPSDFEHSGSGIGFYCVVA